MVADGLRDITRCTTVEPSDTSTVRIRGWLVAIDGPSVYKYMHALFKRVNIFLSVVPLQSEYRNRHFMTSHGSRLSLHPDSKAGEVCWSLGDSCIATNILRFHTLRHQSTIFKLIGKLGDSPAESLIKKAVDHALCQSSSHFIYIISISLMCSTQKSTPRGTQWPPIL